MEATASETRTTTPASEAIDARYRCRIEASLSRVLLLFGINTGPLDFIRRASARTAKEQLCAIRQCEVATVGSARSVLRLIPIDHNLLSGLHGVLSDASSHENIWAARFDGPVFNFTVGAFHIDIDPAMRIDQLHPGHRGIGEVDWLVCIKFSREGMVCQDRCLG